MVTSLLSGLSSLVAQGAQQSAQLANVVEAETRFAVYDSVLEQQPMSSPQNSSYGGVDRFLHRPWSFSTSLKTSTSLQVPFYTLSSQQYHFVKLGFHAIC